ncbi:mitochondrial thiamine pyrophosphate transporter [Venturia effusa]|uniref:Mitochondrial thiamine pyrophosphate carrier 1 n=1 Tax=Venturia effusa TaxID=50376 RepID=A0A517KXH3_9PEZI|nr:mitochondrial thiamine pyrophosphate transporter [Venturia effusa]
MPGRVESLKDEGTQLQVVTAGAVAGLVSRFCVAPLDVIKIRLQLQIHSLSDPLNRPPPGTPIYKGITGTLKQILKEEGIFALWKGNIPAEGLYVFYSGFQFLTYRTTSQFLSSTSSQLHLGENATSFISGALAGTVSTTATYPLDLLRTRFAAQGNTKVYSGLLDGIKQIHRNEGTAGFFRGLRAANAQIIPYMGLFFTFYETFKPLLHAQPLPLESLGTADGLAGIFASVLSKTAVYPLDTVRKRLQVQGPSREKYVHRNIPEYTSGVAATIKMILQREGVRGMYRGLTVALVKAAPTSAITVWTFERVMGVLKRWEDQAETKKQGKD